MNCPLTDKIYDGSFFVNRLVINTVDLKIITFRCLLNYDGSN